jgi:hypothetical protein
MGFEIDFIDNLSTKIYFRRFRPKTVHLLNEKMEQSSSDRKASAHGLENSLRPPNDSFEIEPKCAMHILKTKHTYIV